MPEEKKPKRDKNPILNALPKRTKRKKIVSSSRTEPMLSPQFKRVERRTNEKKVKDANPLLIPATLNLKTPLSKKVLRVIPLGGLCEVGRNMNILEFGQDMLVSDIGVSFPDETHPGIDSIIPNLSYVLQNKNKLRAILITHGHEDHIGALPWLVKEVDCPIYAGKLACKLIEAKLIDHGLKHKLHLIRPIVAHELIEIGVFQVEYIHVNHSIADSFAICITCPVGKVIVTGDFKIDYTPINGDPIDLARLAHLGDEGVLLLLAESTNACRPGFSMSESSVGDCFKEQFAKAKGRIIVATFASNVHRVQQIISAAEDVNRKVAFMGRSMHTVFGAADSLGYIKKRPDTVIDIKEASKHKPEKLVIITTGSQGEPLSALTRMAFSEHRLLEIDPNDTIILSSSPIPGNEKPIYKVIDELYKKGATVIYSELAEVHVSGHACEEELKLIHRLIRPKYFIPVHGEYRMMYQHAMIANKMGQKLSNIFILNNGDIFECNNSQATISGYFNAEPVLIDGKTATSLDNSVIEARKHMAEDGIIVVTLCLDLEHEQLMAPVTIQTQGFVYRDSFEEIKSYTTHFVDQFIKRTLNNNKPLLDCLRSSRFREKLRQSLYEKTKRNPIVMVSVIGIDPDKY